MRSALALCLAFSAMACGGLQPYTPANGDGSGGMSSGDVNVDIVRYTNDARAANGLPPVTSSAKLMEAARIHAEQMAAAGRMDHTIAGSKYPTMQSRLDAVGYVYAAAAENVAWNALNAKDVVTGWMNSSGHRANILNGGLTEMGAAVAQNARGERYWIQVFGRPR